MSASPTPGPVPWRSQNEVCRKTVLISLISWCGHPCSLAGSRASACVDAISRHDCDCRQPDAQRLSRRLRHAPSASQDPRPRVVMILDPWEGVQRACIAANGIPTGRPHGRNCARTHPGLSSQKGVLTFRAAALREALASGSFKRIGLRGSAPLQVVARRDSPRPSHCVAASPSHCAASFALRRPPALRPVPSL
jgi:hypothetical protein